MYKDICSMRYVVCTTLVMTATTAAHQSRSQEVRKSDLAVRGRDCDIPKLGPGGQVTGIGRAWATRRVVCARQIPPSGYYCLLLWSAFRPDVRMSQKIQRSLGEQFPLRCASVSACVYRSKCPGGFGLGWDGTDSFVLTRRARCRTSGKIMVSR